MVFPLLKRWSNAALGIASSHHKSSTGGSYPLPDYDSKQKSMGSSRFRSKRHGGFRHPLSIPNDTAWGSDEAIVTVDGDGKKDGGKGSNEELQVVVEEQEVGFAKDRGSKSDRLGGGPGGIVKTREWQVSGE